jgi:uncharacterized protein (DUF2384 family)
MASLPKIDRLGTSHGIAAQTSVEAVANEGRTLEMAHYRELVARTVDVFGDEIKASRWLSMPNRDLNGQTPLQVAQKSGYELQAIEPILIRIEHGVEF